MTNDSEEKLVTDNINLAYKVASTYYKRLGGYYEFDELVSLCFLGLVKASKLFNPDLDFQFSTYAYKAMENEIIRFVNKTNSNPKPISLSTELTENLELSETISDEFNLEKYVEDLYFKECLHKEIAGLKPQQRTIVEYHLMGYTNKKIAAKLGVSISTVQTTYNKALNLLRYRFYMKYLKGGDL